MKAKSAISRNNHNRSSTQSQVHYNNYSLGEIINTNILTKANNLPNVHKRLYGRHFVYNPEEGNGLLIRAIYSKKKFVNLTSLDTNEFKPYMPEQKFYNIESVDLRRNGRIRRKVMHYRKLSATRLLAPIHFTPVNSQKKVIQARSEISLALKKQNPVLHSAEKISIEISNASRRESYNSESLNELRIVRIPGFLDKPMNLSTVVRRGKIYTPSEEDLYCARNIASNNSMTSFADLLDLPTKPDKTYEYMKVFDQAIYNNSKLPKSKIMMMKHN